jgi:hypothetical protein
MEAVGLLETLVNFYQATQLRILGYGNLQICLRLIECHVLLHGLAIIVIYVLFDSINRP